MPGERDIATLRPGTTRIGWIGTGIMGGPMCGHLLAQGYDVAVHTRTRAKAEALLEAGASWADTPVEAAAGRDVVFTIVGLPGDVRECVLGPRGTLGGVGPGAVLVDMTTSDPGLAVEIAAAAAERGVASLDAPVTGGDVGARAATLSIMVGGDEAAFAAVRPAFEALGRTVVRQGGPGAGQHAKLVNQTLIAGAIVAMCEGLLYAHRAGLALDAVLESVSAGGAASWTLANLAPRVLRGDLGPGFMVDHFVKDLGLALAEASRMRLAVPGLALAHQLYVSLQAQGHGRDGIQSLVLALGSMSDVELPVA